LAIDVPPSPVNRIARVAGYRLIARLRGQTGPIALWKAEDEKSGKRVALGLVDPAEDEAFAERFLHDARRLADLRTDGIAHVHAVGQEPEGVYLVTEPVEGASLRELIRQGGPLSPSRAVYLLGQVGRALDAAHTAGVLHRRVGPDTVVVVERLGEHAFLVDFALGTAAVDPVVGGDAPYYPAPESARGEAASRASDIYAFACVLFQCLSGSPPFGAKRRDQPPASLRALRPELPEALDRTLQRGMAERPADRPASAGKLVAEIVRELIVPREPERPRQRVDVLPAQPPVLAPDGPPERRSPLRAVRSLAIVTLIAVAAVFGYLAGDRGGSVGQPARKAVSATVELWLPPGWHKSAPPSVAGLALDQAVAGKARSGEAGVVAGLAGRSSFPARIAEAIDRSAGRPEVVVVGFGALDAYRWRGLRERRSGRYLTLFLAPTDAGLTATACYAERPTALASCERAAGSLTARHRAPLSVRTLASYAGNLDRTLRRLGLRRADARRSLGRASTPREQGQAASALARIHRATAARLTGVSAPAPAAPAKDALVASLRRVSAAYADLSRAARRGRRVDYRRARRAVGRTERALRRDMARL
jgi:protein kinase-like protein